MQRGSRSIFQELFQQEPQPLKVPKRKSRNAAKHRSRNEFILTRFYYYSNLAKIERRSYTWITENMEKETFLCPETLVGIIRNDKAVLRRLRDAEVTIEQLREQYPWLVWREAKAE